MWMSTGMHGTGRIRPSAGEIATPQAALTPEERHELEELAEFVAGSNLCSHVFPLFVRSFERDTGCKHSAVVHGIVDRIERINNKGLHFGPTVVAQVLRDVGTLPDESQNQ